VADELTAPLGQRKAARRGRMLSAYVPHAVVGALGLLLVAFVLWAVAAEDPLGGEPVALARIEAPAKAAENAPTGQGAPSRYDGPSPGAAPGPAAPAASTTVTIIDGTSGERQEVTIPAGPRGAAGRASPATGQPRLLETSRHGAIPRLGPDGARPAEAYARPVKMPAGRPDGPRIAIVIAGLGIGSSGTAEAFAKLPAPVTFAFTPYSAGVEQLAERARKDGRELLLQVPMEPFDYPDNDPGPQTLLTTLDAGQNIDRLHWLMSRFQGYVGITNYMGARFTASEPALSPVLRETSKRGLIYVDDGSSPRSLAGQIAGASNAAFARAEVVIDAVPTAAEIDRALSRLEAIARERGSAVGIAGALPIAIDHIAKWAKTAEARGFTLVPITALASSSRPKQS
jgi:polysaccharide deacetylase 2 family uncharacterized protein YibQ